MAYRSLAGIASRFSTSFLLRIELAAAILQIDTPKCRVFEVTVEEQHIEIEV